MEIIKSKIEENRQISAQNKVNPDRRRINNSRSVEFSSDSPDFEAYLEELDDNKKITEQKDPAADAKNIPNNPQNAITQGQEANKEILGKDTSFKLDKLEKVRVFSPHKGHIERDFESKFNLDKLTKEDIDFLKVCLENPSITMNNLNSQNFQASLAIQNQNGQVSYKSFDISKGLFNLIEYSFKVQKPVRLDFNGNSSVILKMNNDGKLIAEFISNDKAMEYALKSNLPNLRDRLDSEGIPYDRISYKDNSKNNNKKQQQKGENQ